MCGNRNQTATTALITAGNNQNFFINNTNSLRMKQTKATHRFTLFLWTFICCLAFVQADAQSAARRIQGKITSAVSGEPVAGATILVKGTRNMATTGDAGDFAIMAQTGDVVVISFIGFK